MMTGTAPPSAARHFEDFRLGQVFTSGGRTVTAEDVAAFTRLSGDANRVHTDDAFAREQGFPGIIAQGPLGLAIFFGLLHETGVADGTTVAALDTHWNYHLPVVAGSRLHFEMTITRRRRTSDGRRGVLNRAIELLDQDGRVVQSGTSAALVLCREAGAAEGEAAADPCSAEWAARLAELLNARPSFAESAASFDGSIGLSCGTAATQLRIYRGSVVDHGRWTPHGPTFTVYGDERHWAELATGAANDYLQRVMRGQFSSGGDTYEYLRLTKTLVLLWDAIRDLTAKER
jgi:acyl dehydratase